jgi:hypothetical protein
MQLYIDDLPYKKLKEFFSSNHEQIKHHSRTSLDGIQKEMEPTTYKISSIIAQLHTHTSLLLLRLAK